ncbi:MAG: AmmeMemoRadiSam system radical SAM enzyme [Lentisphaerae bacterium]|jgi:pyruvate formate lyase activating enzyme|nr:AmmeMemoRadiSam system radical SAM enzyme [Lentisphaerota bacterium]
MSLSRKAGDRIICLACGHRCALGEGESGRCGVRKVVGGEFLVPWESVSSLALDPYEKKPLFHFYPGRKVLSFGGLGCNFSCDFCQNWQISQVGKDEAAGGKEHNVTAEELVNLASSRGAYGLAATYNEPIVSAEWVHEVLGLGQEADQPGVLVTNGFASQEALELLLPVVDAANIDLKCFTENGYKWLGGRLGVVQDTIRAMASAGKWVELTTLVVPGFNDSDAELAQIAEFIAGVSTSIPWHISAYHRDYRHRNDVGRTPAERLLAAVDAGRAAGLRYVYTGNFGGLTRCEDTLCPGCGAVAISRSGFSLASYELGDGGKCPHCGQIVDGVW